VGDGITDEEVDPVAEVWEKTESTEERMLDEMEDERLRAVWTIVGSAEKVAYSMHDSALL